MPRRKNRWGVSPSTLAGIQTWAREMDYKRQREEEKRKAAEEDKKRDEARADETAMYEDLIRGFTGETGMNAPMMTKGRGELGLSPFEGLDPMESQVRKPIPTPYTDPAQALDSPAYSGMTPESRSRMLPTIMNMTGANRQRGEAEDQKRVQGEAFAGLRKPFESAEARDEYMSMYPEVWTPTPRVAPTEREMWEKEQGEMAPYINMLKPGGLYENEDFTKTSLPDLPPSVNEMLRKGEGFVPQMTPGQAFDAGDQEASSWTARALKWLQFNPQASPDQWMEYVSAMIIDTLPEGQREYDQNEVAAGYQQAKAYIKANQPKGGVAKPPDVMHEVKMPDGSTISLKTSDYLRYQKDTKTGPYAVAADGVSMTDQMNDISIEMTGFDYDTLQKAAIAESKPVQDMSGAVGATMPNLDTFYRDALNSVTARLQEARSQPPTLDIPSAPTAGELLPAPEAPAATGTSVPAWVSEAVLGEFFASEQEYLDGIQNGWTDKDMYDEWLKEQNSGG